MIAFLKKHRLAYLILFSVLIIFSFLFSRYWPNKMMQRYLAIGLGAFYFIWGAMTHVKRKKLNSEILFEYLAISMLAVLLLILMTL